VIRRHRLVGVIVAIAVGLGAAAAAQSRGNADSIDIGWVGDKSGPTASSQVPALHGLETYIKYLNDRRGINGRPINLIEKDDRYSPATELAAVKSLINDDHVPAIIGLGQSSGFESVLPVMNDAGVVGIPYQSVLKIASDPFQSGMFATTCSYVDQADVAVAYTLAHLHLKSFKGVTVGIASTVASSGLSWTEGVTGAAKRAGATDIVVEQLPPGTPNYDVQAQDAAGKKVKAVFILTSVDGTLTWLRSAAKYGLNVPMILASGGTQELTFTQSPYEVSKDMVGVNCFDPPYLAKTAKAKLIEAMGRKYGIASSAELAQANFAQGWVTGQLLAEALKNAKGDYSSKGIKKGLEKIKNFQTGISAPISFSSRCHLATSPRPYNYSLKTKHLRQVGAWSQWQKYVTHLYAAPGTCGTKK
jgi:branched-chain amino acid transport system substrate-binding protein